MEEYLTVNELCDRLKFARQSIYNLIHKKAFILGRHYLKPSPKKVLFKWSAIQEWMEQASLPASPEPAKVAPQIIGRKKGFINI